VPAADPVFGSLDLRAILDSRPASPDKVPLQSAGSGSEGGSNGGGDAWRTPHDSGAGGAATASGSWQTARSSGAMEGWQTARSGGQWLAQTTNVWSPSSSGTSSEGPVAAAAVADIQLLRVCSRPASPGSAAPGLGPLSSASGSQAEVVQQSFPSEASGRLDGLQAQLSPQPPAAPADASDGAPSAAGSPASVCSSALQHRHAVGTGASGSLGDTRSRGTRSPSPGRQVGRAALSRNVGSGSGSQHSSPSVAEGQQQGQQQALVDSQPLLPQRTSSPPLPGLHVSRRQARLLQVRVLLLPLPLCCRRLSPLLLQLRCGLLHIAAILLGQTLSTTPALTQGNAHPAACSQLWGAWLATPGSPRMPRTCRKR
jgi:hypothetical protein